MEGQSQPAATVAANVRALRARRRLTLGALAGRAGVSKATLSMIEAGSTNPTLETLDRLADALGVALPGLLSPEEVPPVTVVRAGEGADLGDSAVDARLVHALDRDGLLVEVHELRLAVGRRETSTTHGAGSWEHVMLLSGAADVGPVGHEVALEAGDYAAYPADQPHGVRCRGSVPARLLLVLTCARPAAVPGA